jgi:hypothetical protein
MALLLAMKKETQDMKTLKTTIVALAVALSSGFLAGSHALANGGPFLVKYPNGDPAARGVPARLDPNLKPTREERLRVVKEDLTIRFTVDPMYAERVAAPSPRPAPTPKVASPSQAPAAPGMSAPGARLTGLGESANAPRPAVRPAENTSSTSPPLAVVAAAYTIENPTNQAIEVDFGFPILRGIYMSPYAMMPAPDVRVNLDKDYVTPEIISNSQIYGLIRQQARDIIEKAIASDAELARLVATVRATGMVRQRAREAINQAVGKDAALSAAVVKDRQLSAVVAPPDEQEDTELHAARVALSDYLSRTLRWQASDVALMVEFASLDFRSQASHPADRARFFWPAPQELVTANLGPLSAIGEQKGTQFFAKLATCFEPKAATAYEDIFSAWGGDVRERSLDLKSGEIRPREITVTGEELTRKEPGRLGAIAHDPTIYARVDYLDPNANLNARDKASCETVLKNLPVVFTFAPMNLVHYRATFPANSTRTLTVSYKQFAYADTREPGSYQLAYVVHPASMWKDFGPINLEIAAPENVPVRASVSCQDAGVEDRDLPKDMPPWGSEQNRKERLAIRRAVVKDKTGELFIAIDSSAWSKVTDEKASKKDANRQASR